jgi:hypothetical protein
MRASRAGALLEVSMDSAETPDEPISFRWGVRIPRELRSGEFLYQFMLRSYAALGVSPQEFALILHLSAYHYESPRGRACPSIATVATEMGKGTRTVGRMISALVSRGLLLVERHLGWVSTYNARPFAERCLQLWTNRSQEAPEPATPLTPLSEMAWGGYVRNGTRRKGR